MVAVIKPTLPPTLDPSAATPAKTPDRADDLLLLPEKDYWPLSTLDSGRLFVGMATRCGSLNVDFSRHSVFLIRNAPPRLPTPATMNGIAIMPATAAGAATATEDSCCRCYTEPSQNPACRHYSRHHNCCCSFGGSNCNYSYCSTALIPIRWRASNSKFNRNIACFRLA